MKWLGLCVIILILTACTSSPTGQLIKKTEVPKEETYSQYIEPRDLASITDTKKTKILDLREAWLYNAGHIPNSINVPFSELNGARLQAEGISKEYRVILYDTDGRISEISYKIFKQYDYPKLQILTGGYQNWVKNELTVVQSY
jgi:rhodanese-related sulfurtransferase